MKSRVALLAVLGMLLSQGCGGSDGREIVIATVGPMTGPYAAFGEQMNRGARMAVDDINAAGGIGGKKLTLLVEDDACDPKQAVAVANKLVNQGVKFVAGHFCSGSSIPASEVYAEEKILAISPASTNPMLTERGLSNVFRVCGRDDQQGLVAGDYLIENYKDKKVAIVHDKQAYSKGLADETKKRLNEKGVTEAMYEAITPGEKDYSALVTKMKSNQIDVLYYGGYHTELGLIVRQMREQGMKTQVISGDALATEEYWAITGDAGDGTLMTFSPDPRKNAAASSVVEKFRAADYEPEGYTLYTYGAVQVFARAAEMAGGTDDMNALAKAMKSNQFSTIIGDFGFDEKGDVTTPGYIFYRWSKGTYDYAE